MRPPQVGLECGGHIPGHLGTDAGHMMTSDTLDLVLRRFPDSWEASFPQGKRVRLAVEIPPFTQKVVGLKVFIPEQAKLDRSIKLHFVQRHSATRQIVGGVAIQVNLVKGN
jgi:hypothetical protein